MKKEYDFSQAQRGSVVKQTGKTRITMYLDNDVLENFRKMAEQEGRGYQTIINEILQGYTRGASGHLTEESLRKVLREELAAAVH